MGTGKQEEAATMTELKAPRLDYSTPEDAELERAKEVIGRLILYLQKEYALSEDEIMTIIKGGLHVDA